MLRALHVSTVHIFTNTMAPELKCISGKLNQYNQSMPQWVKNGWLCTSCMKAYTDFIYRTFLQPEDDLMLQAVQTDLKTVQIIFCFLMFWQYLQTNSLQEILKSNQNLGSRRHKLITVRKTLNIKKRVVSYSPQPHFTVSTHVDIYFHNSYCCRTFYSLYLVNFSWVEFYTRIQQHHKIKGYIHSVTASVTSGLIWHNSDLMLWKYSLYEENMRNKVLPRCHWSNYLRIYKKHNKCFIFCPETDF